VRNSIKILGIILCVNLMQHSILSARYKSSAMGQKSKTAIIAEQDYVSVDFQIFTAKDCKKYLNSKIVIKKGYQPIKVTFTNYSKDAMELFLDKFSVPCIDSSVVAQALHRDGASRGVGYGVGALFCWWMIIPAIVEGCGANDFNADMDRDFAAKSLQNSIVPAGQTVTGLIFVSSGSACKNITLTVKNQTTQDAVTLQSGKQVVIMPQQKVAVA